MPRSKHDKDPIATRIYSRSDGGDIVVKFWRPVDNQMGNGDYRCRYQILGIGHDVIHHCDGVDSLQALLLAMACAKALLESEKMGLKDKLCFNGTSKSRDIDIDVPLLRQSAVSPVNSADRGLMCSHRRGVVS